MSAPRATMASDALPASGRELMSAHSLDKSYVKNVPILHGVDFAVRAGEVLALVGENGAGKSTLMKILAGLIKPSAGELLVDGDRTAFDSVHDAEARGVVLVPQELRIAPMLSVAENMFIGHLPRTRLGLVDFARLEDQARTWLRFFDMRIDPLDMIGRFSTSEQRMIMLAGALSKNANVLLLDEPTAALTDAETQQLFRHVEKLRAGGMGIVFITHRLDEVEQIADRVVVMRNGRIVDEFASVKGRRSDIVRSMIGRAIEDTPRRDIAATSAGALLMDLRGVTVEDPDVAGKLRVDGLDLTLRAGEIHGLYGLIGAGRTELARALFGDWPGRVSGAFGILDMATRPTSPRGALNAGIAMLTEDRKATGILDGHSLNTNFSAASLARISRFGVIQAEKEFERNARLLAELDVRPADLNAAIDSLSGGNQQKVLLGKWLNSGPRILILDEPTLGVDIGARFHIYQNIGKLADLGLGVLLISSDVDEVLTECDRISVMYKGRKVEEMITDRSREKLVAAATGGM